MQEVSSLLELESESDEVLMMGIYGAAGIGKTILAKEIYNKIENQFHAACFLQNVRENSSRHGLEHLQNMLLTDMLGLKDNKITDVDKGASLIKNMLHSKKVLLILDDVDKLEHLEALVGKPDWFGHGSRVIITTRDKHLLTFHRVERIYEVQLLNPHDSLKLLSHHIFKQGNFDSIYTQFLQDVVSYASGLPLALEVIGLYLFGTSVEEWRSVLHRLERIPHYEIQNTLKTSFDALREGEKSTFLDIACCFQGYELEEVLNILGAHHGYDVKFHIDVLKDKSLVSFSSDGIVTLHPLIANMGKEIVRREDPQEPQNRSRLWFLEDIVEVLTNNTGTSKIEIIHLDSPLIEDEVAIEWSGEAFKKMENLKILIIRKGRFSNAPKYLPDSLKVLEWWRYPSENLPYDFNPNQLVICNLPMKRIKSPKLVELREILWRVYENNKTWRIVGLVSSVVGLMCCALSPSFNRLIKGWNAFKIILYGVLSLAIFTTIVVARQSSHSMKYVLQKVVGFVVLMLIAVCTIYYDRAVNGKPEILSVVSNAAFALMSLCLSKLAKFSHEMGVFTAFLTCFAIQLLTIHWMLISVAIAYGCPIFVMHYSPDSRQEVISEGQVVHSSTDTRQEVIIEGQVVHSSTDTRQDIISEGQVVHSSTDTSGHQHVIDMEQVSGG